MPISLTDFEKGIKTHGILISGGISINLPLNSAGSVAGSIGLSNITSSFVRLRISGNQSVNVGEIVEFSVFFTKTSDEWQ